MRKWLVVSCVVVVTLLAVKTEIGPRLLRNYLMAQVKTACLSCRLWLPPVQIALFPPALSTASIRFSGGTSTRVSVETDNVEIPLQFWAALRGQWRVGLVRVNAPRVEIVDRDSPKTAPTPDAPKPHSTARATDSDSGFPLVVEGVSVENGSFSYTRDHLGYRGGIRVSQIQATSGKVGNSPALRGETTRAQATGVLEKSGKFHLTVAAAVFETHPGITVDLQIHGQNLADVNRFFVPDDGIELHGMLGYGTSQVRVEGNALFASAYARYHDFDVTIHPRKDRSPISALIQNVITSLKMKSQNLDRDIPDCTAQAHLERKPDQSLPNFILNGMKEAALKIPPHGG